MMFLKEVTKIAFVVIGVSSFAAQAEENANWSVGIGQFDATNSIDDASNYNGRYVELSYAFNQFIAIEAKYGSGESERGYGNVDVKLGYAGLNLGYDFNSDWFLVYGKVGTISFDVKGVNAEHGNYHITRTSTSDAEFTYGIGAKFTFSGKGQGFYLKAESMNVTFENDLTDIGLFVGIGYQF